MLPPFRDDGTGADCIYPHAIGAVIYSGCLGERDDARLCRAIRGLAKRHQCVDGRNIHDRPASATDHLRKRRTAAQVGALQASLDIPVPQFRIDVRDMGAMAIIGIIHQNIEAAKGFLGRMQRPIDIRFVRSAANHQRRRAAGPADRLDHGLTAQLVEFQHNHLRAFLREPDGHRLADTGAAARNPRDLSV